MNPLVIITFLAPPFQWLLEHMTTFFGGVGPLNSIGPFGVAVMGLTLIIRAVLFPIFNWQLRTSRRIQREQRMIAPQLQELRKKYKKEPQRLSAEMNKLYREHGISPFSGLTGCLPALVQMPVLIGLYNAINTVTRATSGFVLTASDKHFLWIPDVSKSVVSNGNFAAVGTDPAGLVLPAIAAAFTFAQSRMMMPPPRPDLTAQERSMQNVSRQMSIFFPIMILIFGLILPQGLAIYWATGTMVMVAQQFIVLGWGGLKVPDWFPGAGRVTPLSYPPALPAPAAALVSANGDKKKSNVSAAATEGATTNGTDGTAKEPVLSGPAARRQHPSARARARGNRGGQRRRRR